MKPTCCSKSDSQLQLPPALPCYQWYLEPGGVWSPVMSSPQLRSVLNSICFTSAFSSLWAICPNSEKKWRLFGYAVDTSISEKNHAIEYWGSSTGTTGPVHQFAAHQLCWLCNTVTHRALLVVCIAYIVKAEFNLGHNTLSSQATVKTLHSSLGNGTVSINFWLTAACWMDQGPQVHNLLHTMDIMPTYNDTSRYISHEA